MGLSKTYASVNHERIERSASRVFGNSLGSRLCKLITAALYKSIDGISWSVSERFFLLLSMLSKAGDHPEGVRDVEQEEDSGGG